MKEQLISILKHFDLINKDQEKVFEYRELEGITNNSYLTDLGKNKYVVRIPGINPDLIDRTSEFKNHILANGLEITLPFIYFDEKTGIKISEYIPELRSFSAEDFNNPELRKKAFSKLSRLHKSNLTFEDNFSPMKAFLGLAENADELTEKARTVGASIVKEISELNQDSQPCHQDLYSENFVLIKNDVYLIDWEYSSQGDAFFDYADLFMQNKFTDSMKKVACDELGVKSSKENLLKISLFEMLSFLTWGLWAVNKSKIDDDVNKEAYFSAGKDRAEEAIYRYDNKLF